MYAFPEDHKKLRARIRSYERKLEQEKKEFGAFMDGSGKRYLLGPLYLLMDDIEGSIKSFEWFENEFSDDVGEPYQYLCWTLALYKSNNLNEAKKKALETVFQNLYLIPYLFQIEQKQHDMWHSSNMEWLEYTEYLPAEFIDLWDDKALEWLKQFYNDNKTQDIIKAYVVLNVRLKDLRPGDERGEVINKINKLKENGLNSI